MSDLTRQRCQNHAQREAVARCPECGAFFCRECITEHADRVLCAGCLQALAASSPGRIRAFALLRTTGRFLAGLVMLWIFFYWLGRLLILLPTEFHEGTLWK